MKQKNLFVLIILFFCNQLIAKTDLIFKSGFALNDSVIGMELNDTGIKFGAEVPSHINPTCTSEITAPQDCHQGRDFTHADNSDGYAGFSFTKLDANGNVLSASATNWSCVQDNVTGLVWEVKTTDGGIHNKDNTYRWGGLTRKGNYGKEFYNDWDTLVIGSNTNNFCGFNNWRLPTNHELMGIVQQSRFSPPIDINYFPNTSSSLYWSASPSAENINSAWRVSFETLGYTGDYGSRNNFSHVRLVRFGQ